MEGQSWLSAGTFPTTSVMSTCTICLAGPSCSAVPSSTPVVFRGGVRSSHLLQGSVKRSRTICVTPCTVVPFLLPPCCFGEVGWPRPGVY